MNCKQINIGGIGPVTISKNRLAKRLKISVRPDGTIRASIPWYTSFQNGEKFLTENIQWIAQTRDKLAKKQCVPKLLQPGHLFSTRNFRYEMHPADVNRLKIRYTENEKCILFQYPQHQLVESDEFQKSIKQAIIHVLKFDAKQYLPRRTAELASRLGYTYNNVTIKNNKTNWGSCSNRGNINLNLHLMRLSDQLIDYIIVHELVHTTIPNHGPDFKAAMLRHFKDVSLMDRELKKIRTAL